MAVPLPAFESTAMDQFKQISTFVDVAAKGSLSAAARAEGIAPAMIGRRQLKASLHCFAISAQGQYLHAFVQHDIGPSGPEIGRAHV